MTRDQAEGVEELERQIRGGLKSAITAHGAITENLLPSATKRISGQIVSRSNERKEQAMGLHVFTQEIEAEFVGFPIEGQILSIGPEGVVEVAIGTDEIRDDGAIGSWVRLRADEDRLVSVLRDLADKIENPVE